MRCKNALISTQSAPDQGCGEWDYSCNTYIVDSSRIEELASTHPSHVITNFSGTTFRYKNSPLYDYYRFKQKNAGIISTTGETQKTIGNGNIAVSQVLKTDEHSGKSIILFTAAELLAAGFSAGTIDGIILNVLNSGGVANFLNIDIKSTSDTLLNPDSLNFSNLTNVVNRNFIFINGNNRIQFHSPFNWDGVGNLVFILSFTNSVASQPIILSGHNTLNTKCIYANNNYALDLSSGGIINMNTAALNSINNEISISFWSYGHANQLPANTSILYGYNTIPGQRHINIHLPWANGSIYFDCGYSGSHDRINKAATESEYEGQWNHWAFTKNANTGVMNIFLNGALWHSGTGKTKPMTIQNLKLGNNDVNSANYKGKINELTIWNKALPLNELQQCIYQKPDSTHPSWSNLVAYYRINEGSGSTITDLKNNAVSSGSNIFWTYDRGKNIRTMFSGSTLRPNISLLRGSYVLDTTSFYVTDSLVRNPNLVTSYTITPAPLGSIQHDIVTPLTTLMLYESKPVSLFDGDNDTLISENVVTPDDSIVISTLNYFRRFPFYNEIMSFVTPYGKGLDLGIKGKTWYFDVSDFLPILQGNKRIMMTGGIWQEELDIDFLFIYGTPPRNIIEFKQLWQGAARDGNASISSINNNLRFPPLSVPINSNGQQFKVRATITGHGSEGEFHNNGGLINHSLNINNLNTINWQITEECSMNPIFPQGGTWVYDRQGWCPGQYSLLKEFNLTPWLLPGTSATLDYNCSPPPVSSGDYRYIGAFQLITYGGANHNLDAGILDILAPSDKVVHSRKNPVCANPIIRIQNTGSTILNSIEIEYWLNNANQKQTYVWYGNLNFLDTATIVLPIASLWTNGIQASANIFNARIIKTNGSTDNYIHNNHLSNPIELADKIPSKFILEFKTNNYPQHNTYSLMDDAGNILPLTSILSAPNTIYRDTIELNGCYTLTVNDIQGDGLQWWANTAQGSGYVRIKSVSGAIIKNFQSDFGGGFEYSFSTDTTTNIEEHTQSAPISLYPNPANGYFIIKGINIQNSKIELHDITGQKISAYIKRELNQIEVTTSGLSAGVYFVSIISDNSKEVRKILIQ